MKPKIITICYILLSLVSFSQTENIELELKETRKGVVLISLHNNIKGDSVLFDECFLVGNSDEIDSIWVKSVIEVFVIQNDNKALKSIYIDNIELDYIINCLAWLESNGTFSIEFAIIPELRNYINRNAKLYIEVTMKVYAKSKFMDIKKRLYLVKD